MATERAYWLSWSQIKGVGPVTIKHLWEHFGALEIAWQASASSLVEVDGIGLLSAENIVSQRGKLCPDSILAKHEEHNLSFWTPADSDYPTLLFAINDPPPVLYYRGNLKLNELSNLFVGVVGTRRPSSYGRRWTQRLSRQLTRKGTVIVSGLAAGIDTVAHESCLKEQGLTIAVLGTGVDQVYPTRNTQLQAEIAERGLLLSEYPDGTGPDKKHFPQRNRIIAGLSRAILMTEAPIRSGALITARLANEYCREVYALPCGLDNEQGAGNLRLINQGAQLILGEDTLIEALSELPPIHLPSYSRHSKQALSISLSSAQASGAQMQHRSDRNEDKLSIDPYKLANASVPNLSPMLSQVLEAVPIEPTVLDNIVQVTQIETGKVLGALVQLELLGLVTQLPGMQYQKG